MALILGRPKAGSMGKGQFFCRDFAFVRLGAVGLLLLIANSAPAETDSSDCANVPAGFSAHLPVEITGWAKLECGSLGQKIVAGEGWMWRRIGGDPTNFSGLPLFGGIEAGLGAYFQRIAYAAMSDDEKDALIRQFPEFAIPKRLKESQIFFFSGSSSSGSQFKFMVAWPEQDFGWMYDLAQLPSKEAIAIVNRDHMRKTLEQLKRDRRQP